MKTIIAVVIVVLCSACSSTSSEVALDRRPDALLSNAEFLLNQQNWSVAERRIDEALRAYTKDQDNKGMGDCYWMLGKLERLSHADDTSLQRAIADQTQAIQFYREADWNPGSAVAYAERAQLFFLTGNKARSLSDYDAALAACAQAKIKQPGIKLPVYSSQFPTFEALVMEFRRQVEASK